jgi:hypothetical protein
MVGADNKERALDAVQGKNSENARPASNPVLVDVANVIGTPRTPSDSASHLTQSDNQRTNEQIGRFASSYKTQQWLREQASKVSQAGPLPQTPMREISAVVAVENIAAGSAPQTGSRSGLLSTPDGARSPRQQGQVAPAHVPFAAAVRAPSAIHERSLPSAIEKDATVPTSRVHASFCSHMSSINLLPILAEIAGLHPDTARLLHAEQVLRMFHVFMDACALPPSAAASWISAAPETLGRQPPQAVTSKVIQMNPSSISHAIITYRAFMPQVQVALQRLGYFGTTIDEEIRRFFMSRGHLPSSLTDTVASTRVSNAAQKLLAELTVGFSDFSDFIAGVCQFGSVAHGASVHACAQSRAVVQARLQVLALAQQQNSQMNALRMSLGLAAIVPPSVTPLAETAQEPAVRAIPVVDSRGNVVYVSPMPGISAAPGEAYGMGASTWSGMPGASAACGIIGPYLQIVSGDVAPVRDGALIVTVLHMVDSWAGPPGSDPWYTSAMSYDDYAVKILHKESSIQNVVSEPIATAIIAASAPVEAPPPPVPATQRIAAPKNGGERFDFANFEPVSDFNAIHVGSSLWVREEGMIYPASITGIRKKGEKITFAAEFLQAGEEKGIEATRMYKFRSIAPAAKLRMDETGPAVQPPPESATSELPVAVAEGGQVPKSVWKIGDCVDARFSETLAYKPGRILDSKYDSVKKVWLYDVRYDGPASIRDRGVPETDIRASQGGAENSSLVHNVSLRAGDAVLVRLANSTCMNGTCVKVYQEKGASLVDVLLDDTDSKIIGLSADKVTKRSEQTHDAVTATATAILSPVERVQTALAPPEKLGKLTEQDMDGNILAIGDSVEAKYKGKGTKLYKGKIANITESDGVKLYDIAYDDGDKEEGAKSEHIRRIAETNAATVTLPSAASSSVQSYTPAPESVAFVVETKPESVPSPAPAPAAAPVSTPIPTVASSAIDDALTGHDMDGKILAEGDKVEAKYKGKGARYYKGKISTITESNGLKVYGIAYDDGDKEEGAKSENIRRIGETSAATATLPSAPSSSVQSNTPAPVSVASVVETKPESVLFPAPAPAPAPALATTSTPAPDMAPSAIEDKLTGFDMDGKVLAEGDKVEAKYKGKGARYYKGKISTITESNGLKVYGIAYDDGDKEEGAKSENIRRIGETSAATATLPSAPSSSVQSNTPAPVSVASVVETKPESVLFPAPSAVPTPIPTVASSAIDSKLTGFDMDGKVLAEGDKVEAKYKGKGARYYKGKISTITESNGLKVYGIAYDDGDKEEGAKSEYIRRIGETSAATATLPSAPSSNVQSNTPAPVSVASVVETKPESVLSPAPAPASAPAAAPVPAPIPTVASSAIDGKLTGFDMDGKVLAEGDKVEAKYKGKGARYYKGKISTITESNGLKVYGIAYDDGDKEEGAKSEHIRRIGETNAATVAPSTAPSSSVQSNTPAPVSVASVVETKPESVPSPAPAAPTPIPTVASSIDGKVTGFDMDGKILAEGDKVEAKYKGKGTRFYKATVLKIMDTYGIKSYSLVYDDGDTEDGAFSSNIKLLHSSKPTEASPALEARTQAESHPQPAAFKVGDKIEAKFKGKGVRFYKGIISKVTPQSNGDLFSITYDDGDKEENAKAENIRLLQDAQSESNLEATLTASGKLRVSFSDDHALDLERSRDEATSRYGPGKLEPKKPQASAIQEETTTDDVEDLDYTDASFESLSGSAVNVQAAKPKEKFVDSFKPIDFSSDSNSKVATEKPFKLEVGAQVEALNGKFTWSQAKIMRIASDGGVSVAYEDGGFDFGLPQSKIRPRP